MQLSRKQKQTRLNLFIIRWASWYWPVRPGKYYSSGEREKSQELVISFPKKFCQKKLFTTSRIPAQPKTKIHKKCVVICTDKDRVSETSQTHLEISYSMVWCKPSILDKLDNQNHAVTHWIYRGVLASFILPRLLNVTTQTLTCERTVLATPGEEQNQ